MKSIPRFFIPASAINNQLALVVLEDKNLCKQLTRVLRLRPSSKLELLDGLGTLYRCSLQSCTKDTMKAAIDETVKLEDSSLAKITVALAILKGERFEWALEKLTEIGVVKIIPIVLERSVVKPDLLFSRSNSCKQSPKPNLSNRLARWQSILKEAAEQCERPTIPQLAMPCSFQDMLEQAASDPDSLKIICAERRDAPHLCQVLRAHRKHNKLQRNNQPLCNPSWEKQAKVTIVVGAEGGFTEEEITQARDSGFTPASLGPLILRSETAAIYALTIATAY